MTADDVRNALIDTADGGKVPLGEVAEVVSVGGPNTISRENVQRKLVISANVSGRDVGSVVDDIQKTIDSTITLPEGYRIEYGGQFESARAASRTLALTTILAIFVVFLLLYGEFHSASLTVFLSVCASAEPHWYENSTSGFSGAKPTRFAAFRASERLRCASSAVLFFSTCASTSV